MISTESFPEICREHQETEEWVASQMHLKSRGQHHRTSGSSANHPENSGNSWMLSITERSPRKAERGRTRGCCFQAKCVLVSLAPWCSVRSLKGNTCVLYTRALFNHLREICWPLIEWEGMLCGKGQKQFLGPLPPPREAFILKSYLEATNFTHRGTAVLKVMKIHTVVSKSEENCVNWTSPKALKPIVFQSHF